MFDKQYRFKGRHALRVDQLTGVFDELSKAKLIDRNVDVYANAPLIGFLYGRTADLDDLKNPETGQVYNQNVMGDRVIYSGDELQYNFWLIMLLDANYEPDEEKRIDKAFRHYGQDPADEERFDSYVRGGIDVLYEKLVALVPGTKEVYDGLMSSYSSEFKKEDRDRRCTIGDGKGHLIRCPETNKCSECPYYYSLDKRAYGTATFSNLAKEDEYGKVTEFEPEAPEGYGDGERYARILKDLIEYVAELDPEGAEMIKLLEQNKSRREIAKILKKPKSTVIDKVNKLKPIVQEFLDNIIY